MAKLIDITGKVLSGEWGTDDENGNGIPVLRTTNFTNEGIVNYDNVVTRTITKKNIDEKYLRPGDIILEKSGGSDKQPVGRVIFFDGPERTYLFNNFTGLLRVKDTSKWWPRYVFYSLYANYRRGGTREYENKTTGLHNLKTDAYVSRYEVVEVSYARQKQICELLDLIVGVIRLRRQELQELDDLIKARFVEMFGDPMTNPKGYPVHQLSDYILYLTSGSRGWAKYCVDEGSEWFITIKNVKDCHISIENMQPINAPDNAEAKRTRVQAGDLLISITADLGRTGVVTDEIANHGAYINQHLTCIRLDRNVLNPLYVAYFMESPAGKEQFLSKNQNAVKAGLNFNSINTLKLLVPPMDTQKEFIGFAKQVDKSKVAVQKSLDETQLLFNSLMQKYFG
jgi:type I restriction enzyme S subunit